METEIFKIYKETTHTRWGHRVYEVSNLGRVRLNGEIVEPHMQGNYLNIASFYIHRAVAELFVPNPENKPCVDHINTNSLDNRAENLRWVTTKENCNNPLTRRHRSEVSSGKVHSVETKQKISKIHKGKTLSEETKRKISEYRKGRPLSDVHKQKISESHKGKIFTEEHRAKISAALKAYHDRLANEKERTMKSENYISKT